MRKLWKIKALDKAIRLYMLIKGNPLQTPPDLANIDARHIVIFSTTALGDFLFNSPAIRAIRKRYPEALITLVAHQKFTEFLQDGDDWDNLVFWNNKAITLPGLLNALKKYPKPDLTLLLHSHEPYDYIAALLAGSKCIIKDNYLDNFIYRDKWLSEYTIGFCGHIIERKLSLVQSLGCDISNIEMKMPFAIQEKEANTTPIIGFQLGASTPERCWSPEKFATVAVALLNKYQDLQIILTGGPGDRSRADSFLQHLPEKYHLQVSNKVGNTSLPELAQLLNSMDVLLTGDTGPLHIAVTIKTPTVGLFCTANPYATGPLQNPELHDVIYISPKKSHLKNAHIMDIIEPGIVIEKLINRISLKENHR
ncbi:glycosyltransferase family 9 protein [Pantoea sp. At-9b]|uniref:glycosyltransferase family 9 protein n=1 Tax=Pantoea sp. (strain At-9b) TaxID=592316 RepID=UPI0001B3E891|nr:glycosyltransferase family 9 protein [Pantoea sp. At-9b]ADU71181.1 glycosyl transferase family 9 [Pantoea sp. At-9b]